MVVRFQIISIDQLLSNLERLGFFQFILPFLLALAIFYGALTFALEKQLPKSARGLVSLILAFFVMLFASANPEIVGFLKNLSGGGVIIASGIIMFVVFLAFFGKQPGDILRKDHNIGGVGWGIVFALILIAFGLFSGSMGAVLTFIPGLSSDMVTILIFLLILGLAMWWLSKDEDDKNKRPPHPASG